MHTQCLRVLQLQLVIFRHVCVACRIAHDCTIPAVLQSTSLRLLYNLIETIFQRRADIRTSEQYRNLLSSVLECFVRKLGTLRTQVPNIIRCGLFDNAALAFATQSGSTPKLADCREVEASKSSSVADKSGPVSDDPPMGSPSVSDSRPLLTLGRTHACLHA